MIDSFKRMAEAKIPVTINLLLTADVTDDHPIFNPKCMAVMEAVRKAIHGEEHLQDLIQDDLVLDLNANAALTASHPLLTEVAPILNDMHDG